MPNQGHPPATKPRTTTITLAAHLERAKAAYKEDGERWTKKAEALMTECYNEIYSPKKK